MLSRYPCSPVLSPLPLQLLRTLIPTSFCCVIVTLPFCSILRYIYYALSAYFVHFIVVYFCINRPPCLLEYNSVQVSNYGRATVAPLRAKTGAQKSDHFRPLVSIAFNLSTFL